MNKSDLSNALSLSCVENYFLAYSSDKFDIRQLYVKSFLPFNKVIDSFLYENASYENYNLERIQETSEKLGLTNHQMLTKAIFQSESLNLIRVNKRFFDNSKLRPWRPDHYIEIEEKENGYKYLNNYPLSEGILSTERFCEIYDGNCLIYHIKNKINTKLYVNWFRLQYECIFNETIRDIQVDEKNIIALRGAFLVLKTIRKRITDWLYFECEKGRFNADLDFRLQSEKLSKFYDDCLLFIQVHIVKKQTDLKLLNEKLFRLCEQERKWNMIIKARCS